MSDRALLYSVPVDFVRAYLALLISYMADAIFLPASDFVESLDPINWDRVGHGVDEDERGKLLYIVR